MEKRKELRLRRVIVHYELLKQFLHLPITSKIRDVYVDHEYPHTFGITIESPDFGPVPKGEVIPLVTVQYKQDANAVVEFDKWLL